MEEGEEGERGEGEIEGKIVRQREIERDRKGQGGNKTKREVDEGSGREMEMKGRREWKKKKEWRDGEKWEGE